MSNKKLRGFLRIYLNYGKMKFTKPINNLNKSAQKRRKGRGIRQIQKAAKRRLLKNGF